MTAPAPDVEAALARRAAYKRRATFSSAPVAHPERTEFIVRRACILTMDPHIGDLSPADIHVRDGLIVNIGRDLQASAMHEIDGRGAIAVPGFVVTHRHICTSVLLADVIAPDGCSLEPPDLSAASASDIYCVVRLALLEAMASGFTTVHHCGYDIGGAHAENAILAQIDSGVRGRFSYPFVATPASNPTYPREDLDRLEREWFASHGDHLLDLGIAMADGGDHSLLQESTLPFATNHAAPGILRPTLRERTLGGASTLSVDHCVGSLSPGKCADLVLINGGTRNAPGVLLPQRGYEIAERATAAEVLLVAVDGRLRKQNGVLTEPNEGLIRREGRDAVARLRADAPWPT